MSVSCPFCTRFDSSINSLVILRTRRVILSHMPGIALPGYLVLSPVRHVEHAGGLDADEQHEMARFQSEAVQALLDIPGIRKVYLLSFGEAVPHLHIHLFPRTDVMLDDPECLADGIPDGPKIFDRWRKRLAVPDVPDEVFTLIERLRHVLTICSPSGPHS